MHTVSPVRGSRLVFEPRPEPRWAGYGTGGPTLMSLGALPRHEPAKTVRTVLLATPRISVQADGPDTSESSWNIIGTQP